MTAHKRRLIPIINRRFQLKYTGIIVFIAAIVSTILGFFLYGSYQEMNDILATLTSAEIGASLNTEDSNTVFAGVIGFLIAEVFVLGMLGIVVTHRVCGPIFVMQRHLETLNSGQYPKLRALRKGDEFNELFETFKETVSTLKTRDEDELSTLNQLKSSLKDSSENSDLIRIISQMIQDRESRISSF